MNPNQNMIDYQNTLIQKNIDSINVLSFQIESVRRSIEKENMNIDYFNNLIVDFNSQVDELVAGNALINETIAILSS